MDVKLWEGAKTKLQRYRTSLVINELGYEGFSLIEASFKVVKGPDTVGPRNYFLNKGKKTVAKKALCKRQAYTLKWPIPGTYTVALQGLKVGY